jgi:hypothetical protein
MTTKKNNKATFSYSLAGFPPIEATIQELVNKKWLLESLQPLPDGRNKLFWRSITELPVIDPIDQEYVIIRRHNTKKEFIKFATLYTDKRYNVYDRIPTLYYNQSIYNKDLEPILGQWIVANEFQKLSMMRRRYMYISKRAKYDLGEDFTDNLKSEIRFKVDFNVMSNVLITIRYYLMEKKEKTHYMMKSINVMDEIDLLRKIEDIPYELELSSEEYEGPEINGSVMYTLQNGIFWITYTKRRNPIMSGNHSYKILKIKDFKLITYDTSNNNCLIDNIRIHLKLFNKSEGLKIKSLITEDPNLTIKDIPFLENYLKININVIAPDLIRSYKVKPDSTKKFGYLVNVNEELEYLYQSKNLFPVSVDTCLYQEHIYIIKEKITHKYSDCGNIYTKNLPTLIEEYQMLKSITGDTFEIIAKKKETRNANTKKYKGKKELEVEYLFFDFETVFNFEKFDPLIPYSCSWYTAKDLNSMPTNVNFSYKEYCVQDLISFIDKCPKSKKYILVGFNSSRFDNFILANELSKMDKSFTVFYAKNSILNLYYYKHSSFDLCNYIKSSLDDACEDFKTTHKKVKGFDHLIPQEKYMEGKLDEWILENLTTLKRYNDLDVLCLGELFFKTKKVFDDIESKLNIINFPTIGAYAYKYFKKHSPFDLFSPHNYNDYKFFRKTFIGGRVQVFGSKSIHEFGKFYMYDVKSLYPFVMESYKYPYGDYFYTTEFNNDHIGFYKIKSIKNQPIKRIIPIRNETLKWEYTDDQFDTYQKDEEIYLNSVDINCLKKYGATVEIEYGYCFPLSDFIFKDYVSTFKEIKNQQDKHKKNKDPCYNPSLRNLIKLMLNSLSGKVGQRIFLDTYSFPKTDKEVDNVLSKLKSYDVKMLGNKLLISGQKKVEDETRLNSKPCYLSSLIYSYARSYMYDTLIDPHNVMYMDTDSGLFNSELKLPMSDKFGDYDEEVCCNTIPANEIILLSPKNYMVYNSHCQCKKSHSKFKFKGIGKKDRFLNREDMDYLKPYILKDGSLKQQKEVFDLYKKKLPNDYEAKIFRYIYENKEAHFLCSHLERTIKEGIYRLSHRYMLKKITI